MEDTKPTEIEKPKEKSSRIILIGSAFVVVAFVSAIVGAIAGTLLVPYLFGLQPFKFYRGEYVTTQPSKKTIIETKAEGTVVAVAEKVQPSVVNIRTQNISPDPFRQGTSGVGSGVIIRKDGFILTNNHVVAEADEIFVTVPGRPDYQGRVVGRDPDTDLAVIKVSENNLPAAELGSSDKLKVGELVVAVGSPFSFEQSVTSGIVSALNRNVSTSDNGERVTLTSLIQTDAAINPGNSGGALANSKGEVVGINTLIFSRSGGSQGVGFAIPIDLVRKVANQLIDKGEVEHAYLGILGQTLDKAFADAHNLKTSQGALIVEVVADSPAGKAGLKKDDIISRFGNEPIETMDELIAAIRDHEVGDKVTVTYLRDDKEETVELTLAEKPASL